MIQSRFMSLVESITNVLVGFGVAILTQALVFPLFGIHVTMGDQVAIGGVFSAVSLIRGYLLRRLFEAILVERAR